jgi:hypothetical protein
MVIFFVIPLLLPVQLGMLPEVSFDITSKSKHCYQSVCFPLGILVNILQAHRLDTIFWITRPYNRIHFRYGWRICLNESQHRKLLLDTVTRLHVKQTTTWQEHFILQVKPSFAWRYHTAPQNFASLRDFHSF